MKVVKKHSFTTFSAQKCLPRTIHCSQCLSRTPPSKTENSFLHTCSLFHLHHLRLFLAPILGGQGTEDLLLFVSKKRIQGVLVTILNCLEGGSHGRVRQVRLRVALKGAAGHLTGGRLGAHEASCLRSILRGSEC